MNTHPWFKFYPTDWRASVALQSCSLAARGLCIECLAIMHTATPRGHLCMPNGQAIDAAALAALCRAKLREIEKLLAELDSANVFSRTASGVIFSRKMVREEARSVTAKDNGRRGGNPLLQVVHQVGDSPEVRPGVNQKLAAGVNQKLAAGVNPHSLWPLQERTPEVEGLGTASLAFGEEPFGAEGSS